MPAGSDVPCVTVSKVSNLGIVAAEHRFVNINLDCLW